MSGGNDLQYHNSRTPKKSVYEYSVTQGGSWMLNLPSDVNIPPTRIEVYDRCFSFNEEDALQGLTPVFSCDCCRSQGFPFQGLFKGGERGVCSQVEFLYL